MASTNSLTTEFKESLFGTFRSLPQFQFLWKYDGTVPAELPKNVKISPWFLQQDVLGTFEINFLMHFVCC